MSVVLQYIIVVVIGYFMGCSSMAYYIGRFKGIDMKQNGSKNYGASNTVLLVGKMAGALVFVHDALKSAIPVIVVRLLLPDVQYMAALAGCCAVLGHIFPFYLKFDGGKGFAPFIGMTVALYPLVGLLICVVAIMFAFACDYVVAGTFTFLLATPIVALLQQDYISFTIITAIALVIFFKHKENIRNLCTNNGKEARIRNSLKRKREECDG